MSKKKSIVALIFTVLIVAVLAVATFCNFAIPGTVKDYNSIMSLIGKGIDLSGGYYVVLTPEDTSVDAESETGLIDRAMEILRSRLDDKGFTEATISLQDSNKVRIEVPEVDNADTILEVIGQTGELEFRDSTGHVWLTGDDVKSAYVGYDNDAGYVCVLNFKEEGVTKFSDATYAVLNNADDKKLYIYLGDTVVSQPTVNQQLTTNSAQITGFDSYDDADSVASVIESGRLPIKYTVSEARSISARLGENAISSSLLAGGIAMVVIFILMIIVYRGMGIASSLALCIYTILYVMFLAIVPNVQLTLPGIAGILLSIGMAVDANVVIFERIKDEYSQGKTINTAIKTGFGRAVITVIDSNVTTILSAIVLWILCPGTIKGFAITLLIGIVISMVSSIFVTRWLLKVLLALTEKKEAFFNLKRDASAKQEVTANV